MSTARWVSAVAVLTAAAIVAAEPPEKTARPGDAIDYHDLAFFPKRLEEKHVDTRLVPWEGDKVVFLTTKADLDGRTMARFLDRLDAGWALYTDLVGKSPQPFRQIGGKPTIAAVPDAGLTCGYGCGYVGSTGVEVAGFYSNDYPLVKASPGAFPHYYFYEMGRNYYVFGDRHSLFVTGYAVFMRYVCMDALGCDDPDADTRKVIEKAEAVYAAGDMSFVKGFTTLGGLDEKAPRLKDLSPSDQPVLYASAMLRLRKENGGDAWVKRFLAALSRCPEVKADAPEHALRQSLNWVVAASAAAKKDLTPVFADRWRLPLNEATRKALAGVDWSKDDLDPAKVVAGLPDEFTK